MNFESYFSSLKDQGISLTEAQKRWYMKKYDVLGEDIKKEYPSTPDEAFEINTTGYYYAANISAARSQGRILNIPQDDTLKVHTAWDLGFHDSMVAIFFQISGKEIHIIDFMETVGTSLAEFIKQIKKKDYIYGTHIAPHDIKIHELSTGVTRLETASKLGIHFVLAPDVGFADGIDKVRNTFNRLYFHTSDACMKFVHHIENYSQKWDKTMGLWSGRPDHDEHSHACFTPETLITTPNGQQRIDRLKIGDLVVTPNGNRKILKIYRRDTNKLIKINYGKKEVVCTPEHEFFTSKGLIYADALRYNDYPYLFEDKELCQMKYGLKYSTQNIGFKENFLSQKMKNLFIMMDTNIDGMENIIEPQLQKRVPFLLCIEPFGQKISVIFQKAIIFITKMEIIETMKLQIWKLFRPQIIQNITQICQKEKKFQEKQLVMPCYMLKNGTLAQRVESGIKNKLKTSILENLNYRWSVQNAIKILLEKFTIKDSVQMLAKQEIDTKEESITKQDNVPFVKKNLFVTNTCLQKPALKSVVLNLQESQEVYDLEIEEDHCYYANDFLVSNSDALRYLCLGLDYCLDDAQSLTQEQATALWREHGRRI